MQHKWHKEIKAWADGKEIEQRIPLSKYTNRQTWQPFTGEWVDFVYENDNKMNWEYRIKPQPKQPQYLYVYRISNMGQTEYKLWDNEFGGGAYIGKIKLED